MSAVAGADAGLGEGVDGGVAEGYEPVPSICISERDTVGHFLFVGWRVELSNNHSN